MKTSSRYLPEAYCSWLETLARDVILYGPDAAWSSAISRGGLLQSRQPAAIFDASDSASQRDRHGSSDLEQYLSNSLILLRLKIFHNIPYANPVISGFSASAEIIQLNLRQVAKPPTRSPRQFRTAAASSLESQFPIDNSDTKRIFRMDGGDAAGAN